MGLGFDCSNQTKRAIQRFRKSLNGSITYSRAIPDGKPLRALPFKMSPPPVCCS